jgi:hypothetical protein
MSALDTKRRSPLLSSNETTHAVIGAADEDRRQRIMRAFDAGTPLAKDIKLELSTADGVDWMTRQLVVGMEQDDLSVTERMARQFAAIRMAPGRSPAQWRALPPQLSRDKLAHDLLQFRYLLANGRKTRQLERYIGAFERALARFDRLPPETRQLLDQEIDGALVEVYGRILHVAATPRQKMALSDSWSREAVQNSYCNEAPGVVVIDDFLNPTALAALQRFCNESTVWHGNRYPHGRLGAFFLSGFSCPLLAQIAEELRDQLPRLIGRHHKLRQLWGFKHPPSLPADSTIHADFAAINVNFWTSPEAANRDPTSGGMVIYEADAPPDWDFVTYNERLDVIKNFLVTNQIRSRTIPYRQNRAVIFNSDLFHATAGVDFDKAYETRRVNITMLYGERASDSHHPCLSSRASVGMTPAWRSAAMRRKR